MAKLLKIITNDCYTNWAYLYQLRLKDKIICRNFISFPDKPDDN